MGFHSRGDQRVKAKELSTRLTGEVLAHVVQDDPHSMAIHFESGSALVLQCDGERIAARVRRPLEPESVAAPGSRPTSRQREYLDFICRYMARYGVSPAETDIQRHLMVSAPSVNQMVRTLERRGFITRARDIHGDVLPRSIRVLEGQS